MANSLDNIAYELLADLIQAISDKNVATLEKFGISSAVYEEIIKELDRSGEDIKTLTLPSKDIAFQKLGNRYPIDIYETDDKNIYGIECQLWNNRNASELTLCADLEILEGGYKLSYRIIEIQ
jgi:hypothetical protein